MQAKGAPPISPITCDRAGVARNISVPATTTEAGSETGRLKVSRLSGVSCASLRAGTRKSVASSSTSKGHSISLRMRRRRESLEVRRCRWLQSEESFRNSALETAADTARVKPPRTSGMVISKLKERVFSSGSMSRCASAASSRCSKLNCNDNAYQAAPSSRHTIRATASRI